MTFNEMLIQLQDGKECYRNANTNIKFYLEAGMIYEKATNEPHNLDTITTFSIEDYNATDWEVVQEEVLPTLEQEQVFMYFHPEKNRWVSTTNPQKHLDDGEQVAVFKLDRAV